MAKTLDEALSRLFPGGRPRSEQQPTVPVGPTPPGQVEAPRADASALAAEARAHYDRAMKAQREGNWALYGEEIKRLGEVLEKMSRQRQ